MEGEEGGDDMTEEEEDGDDEEEVSFSRRLWGLLCEGPASASPYLETDHEEMNNGGRTTLLTTKRTSNVQLVVLYFI